MPWGEYDGVLCRATLTCLHVSQEWPLVREVSVSYLEPTIRPPDLPTTRPPRASLPTRIMRRLKNYWYPPVEGNGIDDCLVLCSNRITTTELPQRNYQTSACLFGTTHLCVSSFSTTKSGRAGEVAGTAVFHLGAAYSYAQ